MKINRAKLAQWRSLADSGSGISAEQIQWGVRMLVLSLAALACIYALAQFAGAWRARQLYSVGAEQAENAVPSADPALVELSADTVKSWGWDSAPEVAEIIDEIAAEPEDETVQKTRLDLRLEGTVVAAIPEDSLAMIAVNQKSEQYKQGAKIPVSRGVTLSRVKADRVLLDNNGKLEELLLFSTEMMQQRRVETRPRQSSTPTPGVIDKRSDDKLAHELGRYREMIQRNPNSVNSLMRFSMHVEEGQLAGFKIGAVGNGREFKALGLEDGDIVTHVNGIQLTDYSQAMGLYQGMNELSEIRLQLTRQGQPQEIIYRLPD